MTLPVGRVGRVGAALGDAWRRLRAWRRIRFTRGGAVFTVGALAVGFAAMNTGNNLLFLLLGAMLGLIAVSGWLSEQTIRGLGVRRRVPAGVPVEHDVRISYEVENRKRRLPTMAVEVHEGRLPEVAFVARVGPGETVSARSVNRFVRRGVYPLDVVTLSTSFPFGLFRKERDLSLPGELVIWPRTDRPVRRVSFGGGRARAQGRVPAGAAGTRGDYRGLRGYRPGDDPRDIHWRTSARLDTPVVREYERDGAESHWIVVDLRHEPGDAAEDAVEVAASLAARASEEGKRFGVAAGRSVLEPGGGRAHLPAALDLLARVDFHLAAPFPAPPADPARCVLVTVAGGGSGRAGGAPWGDVVAT